MRKYFLIFSNSLQVGFCYRGDIFFRTIRHLFILIMFLSLWGAVFRTKSVISGFNFQSMVTYYILVEIIDIIYAIWPARIITQQIKNGELSNYLIKPVNHWLMMISRVMGEQIARSSLSFLLVSLAPLVLPKYIYLQTNPLLIALFFIAILIAWILFFQMVYLIGISAFWLSETNYLRVATEQFARIFAGKWVPLAFFSGLALTASNILPFKYFFDFTLNIYLGKTPLESIIKGIAIELCWLFLLVFLGHLIWKRGIIKYESYGR